MGLVELTSEQKKQGGSLLGSKLAGDNATGGSQKAKNLHSINTNDMVAEVRDIWFEIDDNRN